MNVTPIRRALVPGVAALALLLSACGGDAEGDSGDGGDAADLANLSGEVAGGGASSQEAAQLAWIAGFTTVAPEATVTYDPVGSGGGRESFISGAFAFAGSDSYLTDEEGELTSATERCGGEAPIQIPNYISPIAIIHNVEGVDDLNLSPEALAGIFAGKITKWDDPAIAATNEGVSLPSAAIDAVHRSDESGTTENFTDYLDAVAATQWDAGVVETWPEEYGGQGAQGTSGVVDAVTSGTNSIGYADASQAGDLAVANIGVGEEFVAPTPDAAAKILEVSPPAEGASDTALIFDLDHTTAEAGTYPIVLTSYLIACQTYSGDEAAAGELAKGYLSYIVSAEGQQFGADEAGSAPLSDELSSQVQDVVEGITVE
ncbi:phosphate ABC transporter substrate-binding protein PstS [Nocardioides silvaticus]|uniref:Phosphate-binding protein n=1 Tax=Nocardioides silvaticus TaxID=2201891 RepID=A0A316T9W4_9ACTN|nr:phosphate ABC transporter substrate-binding protein PstS [Nocardioides silvaticus]PWN01170.1 phosphate ABC transporter substrate-binding protein PstS [Nocardioides silvaticus]